MYTLHMRLFFKGRGLLNSKRRGISRPIILEIAIENDRLWTKKNKNKKKASKKQNKVKKRTRARPEEEEKGRRSKEKETKLCKIKGSKAVRV